MQLFKTGFAERFLLHLVEDCAVSKIKLMMIYSLNSRTLVSLKEITSLLIYVSTSLVRFAGQDNLLFLIDVKHYTKQKLFYTCSENVPIFLIS